VPTLRPLKGRILSGFGYRRDPISGGVHFHPGLDLDARYGEPIHAVAEGTVIEAGGSDGGYGIQVEIDHGYGYVTKYAHMSKLAVKPGQKVKRKDVIGYVGNTGYSVGAHLHYEVIRYGNKIDPRDYILAD
jgi:murein DD-endopeptidase MepM/ murein hydrolase activator NlpD